MSETDRLELGIIAPDDIDWPAALNNPGERTQACYGYAAPHRFSAHRCAIV
ncbi:hypothetical protein [Microbacterium lacticum]